MEASKLFVPGMWECPQCGFTQMNNVLSPAGVFANTKPELRPCPNDGRDMQAVTWKEYAERTDKALGRVLDEREELQRDLQVIYDLESDLKKEGMEHFLDYFCHWNTIINFAAGAGVSGYAQDPMELLAALVNQRDEAREKVGQLMAVADAAKKLVEAEERFVEESGHAWSDAVIEEVQACKTELRKLEN